METLETFKHLKSFLGPTNVEIENISKEIKIIEDEIDPKMEKLRKLKSQLVKLLEFKNVLETMGNRICPNCQKK